MSTKKKSDAMKFLESLVGELTFGGLIEAMRQAEEMSQVEFAKKFGISKQHLGLWGQTFESKQSWKGWLRFEQGWLQILSVLICGR